MRFLRDEFSIESGIAKGRPLPDWYLDKPELLLGEEWFLRAYWDLATERMGGGGMTLGRIPWSKAMQYGSYAGLLEPMLSHFWTIIARMDGGYLEWMKNEHDRHARSGKKSKAKKPTDRYSRA